MAQLEPAANGNGAVKGTTTLAYQGGSTWLHLVEGQVSQAPQAVHSVDQLKSGGGAKAVAECRYFSSQLLVMDLRVLPEWALAARIRSMPVDKLAD